MKADTVFRWNPGSVCLEEVMPESDEVLLAADSWLVSEGRVRGFTLHWDRFAGACRDAGELEQEEIDAFSREVTAVLPRQGKWFPRVELIGLDDAAALQFRLRSAPPLTQSVRMMRWRGKDTRMLPRRKGPDLALLGRMRQQAIAQGADEALLTTPDGIVLEGLTTSLAWWEEESLCIPDPMLSVLPGVTCRLLIRMAHNMRIPIQHRCVHIDELSGRTVWTLNALHGIRPVVQWIGSANEAACDVDHRPWQSRLCNLALPLDMFSGSETDARQGADLPS
jgi:branched-subunit amino acid aminotransferase/4-amino-4-deoxychorismate lyase